MQLDASKLLYALGDLRGKIKSISTSGSYMMDADSWQKTFDSLDSALVYRPTEKRINKTYTIRTIILFSLSTAVVVASAAVAIGFLISPIGVGLAIMCGLAAAAVASIIVLAIHKEAGFPLFDFDRYAKSVVKSAAKKIGIEQLEKGRAFIVEKIKAIRDERREAERSKDEYNAKQTRDRVIAEREKAVTAPYQKGADGKSPAYEAVEKNRVEKLAFVEGEIEAVTQELTKVQKTIDAIEAVIESGSQNAATALAELKKSDVCNDNRVINDHTTLKEFRALEKNPGIYNSSSLGHVAADLAQKQYKGELLAMKELLLKNHELLVAKSKQLNSEDVWRRVNRYQNEARPFDARHSISNKLIRKSPERFNGRYRESLSVTIGSNTHRLFASSSHKMAGDLLALRKEKLPGLK